MVHEIIYHAAEADEVVKRRIFLTGILGKMIASDGVTIVDDVTIPGAYGSISFDNEGTPGSRNSIIEMGKIVRKIVKYALLLGNIFEVLANVTGNG